MLCLENIHIEYNKVLLENETLCIYPSSLTLIKGRSGSGKSTLLYRVGFIHYPIDYDYYINEHNLRNAKESEIASIRKNQMAFVLQDSLIFHHYNVLENLKHACMVNQTEKSPEELLQLLHEVKLDISFDQRINQLSGGEKQRLAIACALCKNPRILILDEPTSALDIENERIIFEILKQIAKSRQICIIIASHSYVADDYADQIYEIKDNHLNCIKNYKNDEKLPLNTERKLTPYFFHYYTNHFRKSYQFMYRFIIIVLACMITLVCGIYQVIDKKINDNQLLLDTISNNQLVITGNKENKYVDDTYIDYVDFYEQFKNIEGIKNVYPLYQYQINIDGVLFYVLPIYKENNYIEECSQVYSHHSKNPQILLTTSLYRDLSSYLINEKQFSYHLQTYNILGLLKQNYNTPYLGHSNKYIYVDYEVIEYIADINHLRPIGYSVFCNDLKSLEEVEQYFIQYNCGMNNTFQKGKELRFIQTQLEETRCLLIISLTILSIIFLIALFYHYVQLRTKEFALLKVNGLGQKDILHIMIKELFFFNTRGYIIPVVVILIISKRMNMNISLGLIYHILSLIVIQILISYYVNKQFIVKISPEEVFRN